MPVQLPLEVHHIGGMPRLANPEHPPRNGEKGRQDGRVASDKVIGRAHRDRDPRVELQQVITGEWHCSETNSQQLESSPEAHHGGVPRLASPGQPPRRKRKGARREKGEWPQTK